MNFPIFESRSHFLTDPWKGSECHIHPSLLREIQKGITTVT